MPLPPAETRPLWAVGARRASADRPDPAEIVRRVRELSRDSPALLAVLDARAVAGERHLLSAWAHLGRARERGEARLKDRGAEFLLFVAGDDQLPRALRKVGVGPDSTEFVVAGERPRTSKELLERLDFVEAPEVFPRPIGIEGLSRLGIDEADRQVVPETGYEGLVLERIALLELEAPHAGADTSRGKDRVPPSAGARKTHSAAEE